MRTLLISICAVSSVVLQCCSFMGIRSTTLARRFSSSYNSANRDYIHQEDYPDDDFDHILGYSDPSHQPSKLQSISAFRLKDVALSKKPIDTDGCGIDRSFFVSAEDLEEHIKEFDELYGKPLNLAERIAATHPKMAIAAEFKRASPSKGDINPDLNAVTQCLEYAKVGAAVISVLTEFRHFKGTLADMKSVRLATQKELGANRPAILRKDFVLDRYQVLEARASGADTLLLIVAILGVEQLKDLMQYSRKFGMEPLVEVHTSREMEIALQCGAKVIGVNNRNLHTFKLDLDTTERAISIAEKQGFTWRLEDGKPRPDILVAALSGITSNDDVQQFRRAGVSCVLVGETLMKSADPKKTIEELLDERVSGADNVKRAIVKTCGLTSVEDAEVALQAGANLLGVIFATSPRAATVDQAKAIVDATRRYGERSAPISMETEIAALNKDRLSPKLWFSRFGEYIRKTTLRRPLVVGVFQDQSVDEINDIVARTGIDVVQLHGDEPASVIEQISVPCIKVLHVTPTILSSSPDAIIQRLQAQTEEFAGKAIALLLDSRLPGGKGGGTGATFDWSIASKLNGVPVLLAGGLTAQNAKDAAATAGVLGVDVSSGVESSPGKKDAEAVKAFVSSARS